MLFGESFEEPARSNDPGLSGMWGRTDNAQNMSYITNASDAFNGNSYQRLGCMYSPGEIVNRGLAEQQPWGLALKQGHAYHGSLYARVAPNTGPYKLTVSLEREVPEQSMHGRSLARVELTVSESRWTRYEFKLTPAASTTCSRGGGSPRLG
jgi:hypothetical protein